VITTQLIAEEVIKHVGAAEGRTDGRLCDWLARGSGILLARLAVTYVVSHVRATKKRRGGRHAGVDGFSPGESETEREIGAAVEVIGGEKQARASHWLPEVIYAHTHA